MSQEQIAARQIGQNILVTVDGKKLSRKVEAKKDREMILAKVVAYNKRNSKAKKAEIVSFMETDTKAKEEKDTKKRTKAKAKTPVAEKAPAKKVTEKELADAKKLLEQHGYNISKVVSSTQASGYRGRREH